MRLRLPLPIGLLQFAGLTWVLVLCLGFLQRAEATESAAAAVAVAKLLSLPLPGSEANAGTSASARRGVVLTLRGENLDRIVRRAWPKHPFKDEFMRKAFVLLNPEALGKNPSRVLPPGTALFVPTAHDLQALLAEQYPVMGTASAAEQEESAAAAALAARRRWVHYP